MPIRTAPLCAAGYQHVTSLWQSKIRVLQVVITTWQYVFWHVKYWNWGLWYVTLDRQIDSSWRKGSWCLHLRDVFIFSVRESWHLPENLESRSTLCFLRTLLSPPSEEESSIKLYDARKGDEGLNEGLYEGILSLHQDQSAFSLSVLIFRYSFFKLYRSAYTVLIVLQEGELRDNFCAKCAFA
jgi:hypothetical protein